MFHPFYPMVTTLRHLYISLTGQRAPSIRNMVMHKHKQPYTHNNKLTKRRASSIHKNSMKKGRRVISNTIFANMKLVHFIGYVALATECSDIYTLSLTMLKKTFNQIQYVV